MMYRGLLIGLLTLCLPGMVLRAQDKKFSIKGQVKDEATGETIIGAIVSLDGNSKATDLDGNFSFEASLGDHELTIAFVGYTAQKKKLKIKDAGVSLSISLASTTLKEVEIVADVARARETPVAFSTISSQKIQQELGSRDLPMILNQTPGVYATESGGGSGDARINIRGFDQRNVAVLVDGIPVNDMENGQVYWSNWDGLAEITRSMQVQRGLGASKLAIASVGGTINTLTKGIDNAMGGVIKQDVGNNNSLRTSIAFNTGLLKGNWGFTAAVSRKTTDGWVDQTWSDAYSYFFKIQKRFKKHLISLGANGAPQSHGQRLSATGNGAFNIATYDANYARSLGVNVDSIQQAGFPERGRRFNPNWGTYVDSVTGKTVTLSERVNFYHKPLVNLSHFWNPSNAVSVSTIAYVSYGSGGGTGRSSGFAPGITPGGQTDWQSTVNGNRKFIDKYYDSTLYKTSNYLRTSWNNHFWYGMISSAQVKATNRLTLLGGIDLRRYTGYHYQTAENLIGADYTLDFSNLNQPRARNINDPNKMAAVKKKGDVVAYNYTGYVDWGGAFAQAEYRGGWWSTFVTTSFSATGYQRRDYFKRKDVVVDGKVLAQMVGWGDTLFYNGKDTARALYGDRITRRNDTIIIRNRIPNTNRYRFDTIVGAKEYNNNSPEARYTVTDVKWFMGYTIKTGANFNLNEYNNLFINLGYMSIAPRFDNVYDRNNRLFQGANNQLVKAIELGYGYKIRNFRTNLNAYYTDWSNKPVNGTPTITDPISGDLVSININGIGVLHRGVELDAFYQPFSWLEVDGLLSIGNWTYKDDVTAYAYDLNGNYIDTFKLYLKGIRVGDAAQFQTGGGIKLNFLKDLYFKTRYVYFTNNFANFDPASFKTPNPRYTWQVPAYGVFDAFAGADIKGNKSLRYSISLGVFNVLDKSFITDAINGTSFDANTATVYMGQGRRYNLSLKISF